VQIDPQLGYGTTAWWLEYATALKLVNWPDRPGPADTRLVLEAASGLAVSNRGKTYTFVIRKSLRFSDGSPSTTAAPRKSRVTAKGYRLVIRLTRPDCTFLSKLTMPFFQATSRTLPLSREVESAYPSAARVHEACPELGDEAAAQPLPPGSRPRHLAGVDVSWNLNLRVACNQDFGQSFCNLDELNDQFLVSESEVAGIARKYGVNKTRFWSKPTPCVGCSSSTTPAGSSGQNAPLRRAVSWALDRTDQAALFEAVRLLAVDTHAPAPVPGVDWHEVPAAVLREVEHRACEEAGQGPLPEREGRDLGRQRQGGPAVRRPRAARPDPHGLPARGRHVQDVALVHRRPSAY
jgi:hypothetical protein